ncbi:MAG: GspH/FimT family pseudopilin [Cocleimonas sp.]|nr:GspH/FimT family pseudopilin [Cocleimonas sp.]
MNNNKKKQGFTLIEAIATIAVASILLGLAIPSFSNMIERNRISSATHEFMAAMRLSRSEAITRIIPVSLCVSNTGTSCDTTLGNYAKGWVVFSDCDGNGAFDAVTTCDFDGDGINDADTVINVHSGVKKIVILGSGTTINKFTYDVSGRPNTVPPTDFQIGANASHIKKKVTVALTGRLKICNTDNSGACQ